MKTLTFVLMALAGLGFAACNNDSANDSGPPLTPSPAPGTTTVQRNTFSFLNGTWAGEWVDTRFGVRGSLTATFTVNGTAVDSVGTIGLRSLGLGDEQGIGTGTINGDSLSFTFEARTVGDGEGTLANGSGTGMGTVLGVLNFGDFTFDGTVDETTIDGTFAFTDPAGGRGTARLTKQ